MDPWSQQNGSTCAIVLWGLRSWTRSFNTGVIFGWELAGIIETVGDGKNENILGPETWVLVLKQPKPV